MAYTFVVNPDCYWDATFAKPETVSNPHALNEPPIHRKQRGDYYPS
jgi:hypothetical protein